MMRSILRLATGATVTMSLLALLGAQTATAETKVGFVDQRRGILSTDQGKEASKALESKAEEMKAQMEPKQQRFLQLQEELESQRFVLSQSALEERAIEVEKQKRELEREVSAARDDLQIQERKLLKPVLDKWEKAVSELGKEKNFDVILDRGTPGVLFYKDALDVTDLVVQRVNKMQ